VKFIDFSIKVLRHFWTKSYFGIRIWGGDFSLRY
jgi:hypothetical protein